MFTLFRSSLNALKNPVSIKICANSLSVTNFAKQFVQKNTNSFSLYHTSVQTCNHNSVRYFGTSILTPEQIIDKIEACGINDAGKENILKNEIKNKNFDNLYIVSEKLLPKEETRELGVLSNVLLAEAGYPKSIIELGNMYYIKWKNDKDDSKRVEFADHSLTKSIYWLQKAAEKNDALGKSLLAKVYLESKGKDKIQESLKLLEEAGQQKNADALYNLGLIYYDGLYTIKKDVEKALNYFKQASDLNDISALTFVGQYSIIHEHKINEGLQLLYKSKDLGDSNAAIFLSNLYMEGEYIPKDIEKAWTYLLEAGNKFEDADALNQIGVAYFTGDYNQHVNYSKALNYFYKANQYGNDEAMKNMGIMYYNGYGVPKDKKKAFEYYTKASENGNIEALRSIGFMYMTGEGCEKDKKTAENILKFVELEESRQSGNTIVENDKSVKDEIAKQL